MLAGFCATGFRLRHKKWRKPSVCPSCHVSLIHNLVYECIVDCGECERMLTKKRNAVSLYFIRVFERWRMVVRAEGAITANYCIVF